MNPEVDTAPQVGGDIQVSPDNLLHEIGEQAIEIKVLKAQLAQAQMIVNGLWARVRDLTPAEDAEPDESPPTGVLREPTPISPDLAEGPFDPA